MMLENYLNKISIILYHGSPIQNLKIIKPSRITFNHINDKIKVSATFDKKYASAFTFKNVDGNTLDVYGIPTWYSWRRFIDSNTIQLSKKFKNSLLNSKCSVYVLNPTGFKPDIYNSEYFSITPAIVIKEYKYESPVQAMQKNGWNISWR